MADLEVVDLRAVLLVAETGSFSSAAAMLRVSQPSVSTRMAAVERRLGAPLFVRAARGTSLTPAGEELVRYARRTLALLDEAGQAVRTVQGRQRLGLAAPAGLVSTIVPGVLAAVRGLRVDLRTWDAHSPDVISAILDGQAHIGFITHRAAPAVIDSRHIVRSPVVAVAHPRHPLVRADGRRGSEPATIAQIANAGPVAVHAFGPTSEEIIADLRVHAPDQDIVHVAPGQVPGELAIHLGFVAIGPVCMFASSLGSGQVVAFPARIRATRMDVRMVYHAGDRDQPLIKALCAAIPTLRRAMQPAGAPTSAAGAGVTRARDDVRAGPPPGRSAARAIAPTP